MTSSNQTKFIDYINSTFFDGDQNATTNEPGDLQTTAAAAEFNSQLFEGIVDLLGLLGTLANGLVMSVLISVNRHNRKLTNALIVNQMSTDLFSCVSITVTYSVKLQNYYLIDRWGALLCKFIMNEYFI